MSTALTSFWKVRDRLPPSTRQAVRRATDPVLAPVGSVAGARPTAARPAAVGLTFDDGPDPEVTPAVLDALAAGGTRATFFMLVDRAERHPGVVRRVVDAGHEVGLHGPDHRRLTTAGGDRGEVRRALAAARARLEALAGVPVRWFRPPFGSQSVGTYLATRRAGLVPVVWTAEGEDWVDQPAARVADRVMERLRPGGIVLLHDGLAGDPREPETPDPLRDVRGEIVGHVLANLAAHDLRGTTIGDLVAGGRPHRSAWFRP
ncbi:MAG TPA: polysaccharide deacetylase family protein [Acidimicrobiales bacterium]|nr:polysaccharide deacetylase family protein [Acidimicrobiales bacterium]